MRDVSHKTVIGRIRESVVMWRKSLGWSRETVVQQIVEAHERIGAVESTGIRFDPTTQDAIDRMKVNADRVFRWLDDEQKDTNLLPVNFLPSILAALPIDLRVELVSEMLRPLGIVARAINSPNKPGLDVSGHLVEMIKESAEANQAVIVLQADPTPANLARAHRELTEAIDAKKRTKDAVEGEMVRAGQVA